MYTNQKVVKKVFLYELKKVPKEKNLGSAS